MYIFGNNIFHKKQNGWEEHVNNTVFYYNEVYKDEDFILLEDKSRNIDLKLWYKTNNCKVEISEQNKCFKLLYSNGKYSDAVIPKIYDIKKFNVTPKFLRGEKSIGIVSLATPNMKSMTDLSFKNHMFYAKKHKYSYICYEDTLVDFKYVTWNKVYVLQQLIESFEYIYWIDADAIFTNMDITLECIIEQNPDKYLHVCDDIGGWKLNTGSMIWKNHPWCKTIIEEWCAMEKIPHNQGAEQQQLINLLKKNDPVCKYWHVYNRRLFNAHPKDHQAGDFVLHMMGLSGKERIETFKQWNCRLNVQIV